MDTRHSIVVAAGFCMMIAGGGIAVGALRVADHALAKHERAETLREWRMRNLPRVVIGKHEITYRGQLVATVDAVTFDDSPTFKIDALQELLERDRHGRCMPHRICVENIVIVEAPENPDLRLLGKVQLTIWAAGYDSLMFAPGRGPISW